MRTAKFVISHICQYTAGFDLEAETERENIEKHVLRKEGAGNNYCILWTRIRKLVIYRRKV
jgi:hypothetical protein